MKFFLTASPEVRAQRRFEELQAKGSKESYKETLKKIIDRDYNDSHRSVAPLKQTKNHILVDTSEMSIDEVVAHMGSIVREKCKL